MSQGKEFIEFSPSWPACTLKFEILCPLRKTKSFEKVFVHMLDSTILTNHTFNKLGQVQMNNLMFVFEEYQTFRCNMKSFLSAWLFDLGFLKLETLSEILALFFLPCYHNSSPGFLGVCVCHIPQTHGAHTILN